MRHDYPSFLVLVILALALSITPAVSYTRGTDLSGSLEGAGGIGGLLARSHGYSGGTGNWSTHNFYHADGNGNTTYLVNSSQTLAASYRYDPFGNTLSQSGSLAFYNVYRFSSKEFHADSGLYYYGERWYSPNLQRWLNRDPIGEKGGLNLYGFVFNDPLSRFDVDGRFCLCKSLKFWRRDGSPIFVWSTMDIGEEVEERNRVAQGTGRVRHCVAACLIKRHFGGIFGVNMRDAWDYFHEDPANEDSRRDMQAEDVGEGFACTVDETCESACVAHFKRNPQ